MLFALLADAVLLLHAAFVLFVMLGGLLLRRWPRLAWIHLPAAVWGVALEFGGWICPLTPLENALRARAGLAQYRGGFIEHYLVPLLYPAGLTRPAQWLFGVVAALVNVAAYGLLLWSRRKES